MRLELKQLIDSEKIDVVIDKLDKIVRNGDPAYQDFISIKEQWGRYQQGFSRGIYTFDQVKRSVQVDLLELLAGMDFDKIEKDTADKKAVDLSRSALTKHNARQTNEDLRYVGFWKRVLIKILDGLFGLVLFPLSRWMTIYSFDHKNIAPIIISSFIFMAIQIFLVTRYGGTLAKLVLGIRIIDDTGNYLKVDKAIIRDIIYIFITGLSLIPIITTIQSIDPEVKVDSYRQVITLIRLYAYDEYRYINLFNVFAIIDVLTVAFNSRKRAIHDYLAGSYVVTLDSLKGFKAHAGKG